MTPIIYADKIFYYESIIDNPEELVKLIEETDLDLTEQDAITQWLEWVASGDGEKYVFGHHKHTDESKILTSSEKVKLIYNTLKTSLVLAGQDYASTQGIQYIDPSPISISKYVKGATMGPHVDWYGDESVEPIMSAVTYLNDDMVGGELYFKNQDVKIKPKAGSIVVFPSVDPFVHESLPILDGHKYMSPAFWIRHK